MKRFPIVLVLVSLMVASGCGPASRHRTAALLDDVETFINERPDSALAVLRALDSTAVRSRALRARASLLHSMALDKCYIDLQTDSVLAPAIAWYGRHGTPDDKLRVQYYLGRLQYNAGEYQKAIVTYTEALALSDRAQDYKYIGFVNQAIADTYAATYQESESFPYLDRAYEAFLQIPDSVLAKRTLYKKALALTDQHKWQKADTLYNLLLNNLRGIENLASRIRATYALHLVRQDADNVEVAAELFSEVLGMDGSMRSANLWAAYGYSLSRIGKEAIAEEIFQQLEEVYPDDQRVLLWRSLMKEDAGCYREALVDYQALVAYQDSLLGIQLNHSTLAAQKEYFENHTLLARQTARRRSFALWMVLLLSCLVVTLVFVILRRINLRQQRDNARLQQTIEAVNKQLASAGVEQTVIRKQFNILFQDYFSTLGKICADYEEGYLNKNAASDRAVLRRLDKIIWDFTGKSGDHKAFERLLNKYMDNIMSDFRADYPKMRQPAYYLVGYIFAGLDLQTISVLMGVDVDALYARKYRIKSEIIKSSSPEKSRYLDLFR